MNRPGECVLVVNNVIEQRLGSQRESGDMAPRRAKDGESGADFSKAQGEGIRTPAGARKTVGGTLQEFPA